MPKTPTTPQNNMPSRRFFGDNPMSKTETAFPLTHHAKRRRQQRAVSRAAIDLVCHFGKSFPAGDGCRRNILLVRDVAWLMGDGASVAIVEEALRLVVITSAEGAVITCYAEARRPSLRRSGRERKAACRQRR